MIRETTARFTEAILAADRQRHAEPARPLAAEPFVVHFYDRLGTRMDEIRLSFAPYPGLNLIASWHHGGSFAVVDEVFWDARAQVFECYARQGES